VSLKDLLFRRRHKLPDVPTHQRDEKDDDTVAVKADLEEKLHRFSQRVHVLEWQADVEGRLPDKPASGER
jgi:hypothetical protein